MAGYLFLGGGLIALPLCGLLPASGSAFFKHLLEISASSLDDFFVTLKLDRSALTSYVGGSYFHESFEKIVGTVRLFRVL